MIPKIEDIPKIMADRKLFEKMIFTTLPTALKELKKRRKNEKLDKKVKQLLNNDIPQVLESSPKAVIFRQVITPNYEIIRFLHIIDKIDELEPIFFDHCLDKFVANNPWKYRLGKMCFYTEKDENGHSKKEILKVIDFNKYDGKQIAEIKTLWGQSLISFHKELFLRAYPKMENNIFYASEWLFRNGGSANGYYKSFLLLFVRHGILFENFLNSDKEKIFIEKTVLPAFIHVYQKLGLKPLIVQLEPTDTEEEEFWMYHPYKEKAYVGKKLNQTMIK